jgi:hypothetical protein
MQKKKKKNGTKGGKHVQIRRVERQLGVAERR